MHSVLPGSNNPEKWGRKLQKLGIYKTFIIKKLLWAKISKSNGKSESASKNKIPEWKKKSEEKSVLGGVDD